jgi:hypothetical protein
MNAIPFLIGLIVALFGRRLFWFFVGAVGFFLGFLFVQNFAAGQPDWLILLAIALGGVAGAVLAVVLQKAAIAVAGFLVGAYALANLAILFGGEEFQMLAFCVGGVVSAILVFIVFDWALIVFSALGGAILIGHALEFSPTISAASFIATLILGLAVQFQDVRARAKRQEPKQQVPA